MNITFYGAARGVTGSCHLLEAANKKILIDCGLFQGRLTDQMLNYEDFPFNINDIDNDVIKDFKKNNNYVNFKYYIHPELVIFIDMLIAGNVSALDKIINYEIKDIKARELLNDYHV